MLSQIISNPPKNDSCTSYYMKYTQLDPIKLTPNGPKQTPMDPYLTDPHGSTIETPSEAYYHMKPQT